MPTSPTAPSRNLMASQDEEEQVLGNASALQLAANGLSSDSGSCSLTRQEQYLLECEREQRRAAADTPFFIDSMLKSQLPPGSTGSEQDRRAVELQLTPVKQQSPTNRTSEPTGTRLVLESEPEVQAEARPEELRELEELRLLEELAEGDYSETDSDHQSPSSATTVAHAVAATVTAMSRDDRMPPPPPELVNTHTARSVGGCKVETAKEWLLLLGIAPNSEPAVALGWVADPTSRPDELRRNATQSGEGLRGTDDPGLEFVWRNPMRRRGKETSARD